MKYQLTNTAINLQVFPVSIQSTCQSVQKNTLQRERQIASYATSICKKPCLMLTNEEILDHCIRPVFLWRRSRHRSSVRFH